MAGSSERSRRVERRWTSGQPSARWLLIGLALAVLLGGILFVLGSEIVLREGHPTRRFFGAGLSFLAAHEFVLLFLTLAGGYAIAGVDVKGVSLGATAGTLVFAMAVSLWASAAHGIAFELPDAVGTLFFNLFLFAVGIKIGPQFLVGLRRGARQSLILGVSIPLFAMGLMLVLRALTDVPSGIVVGIFAGANTATPSLAAAQAAFASGAAVHVGEVAQAERNMATAFAFSYCVSTVLFVVLLKVLPSLFGKDPVAEGRKFEAEVLSDGTPLPGAAGSLLTGALPVTHRSYLLERPGPVGHSLAELREAFPQLEVAALLRDGQLSSSSDETILRQGDVLAVFGPTSLLLELPARLGPEVVDPRLPRLELETVEVVLENRSLVGRKVVELARDVGHGLYLNALFRSGEHLPRGPEVVLERGDVLRVTGSPGRVARLEQEMGPLVRLTVSTDILTLCLGLALGSFLGALTLPVGRIELGLGSVALLLVGVVLSAVRARNPTFGGPFPEPARKLFEDLGLNVFVAVLGLNSGMGILQASQEGALLPILGSSVLIGLLPAVLGWAVGQYWLKMNAAELMGAVAGARSSSTAMRAAVESTASNAPAIAYPVTFAVASVLLTVITYSLAVLN